MKITDREFTRISELVYDRAGINLHIGKKQLVQTRLGKIMRQQDIKDFSDYYSLILQDNSGNKLVELLDAISTNHTFFFREKEHLRWLSDRILPDIFTLESVNQTNQIRIWSAGCSTGEEPYTLAIHILENCTSIKDIQIKLLATDLSSKVISVAQNGVYRSEKLKSVPKNLISKYFQKGTGGAEGLYRIRENISDLITFRIFNLMDPFPFRKQFDVIFCRNVMIYFDKQTQQKTVEKFQKYVKPGGYFVVGHSESLSGINHGFKYIAPTIYRKIY